MRRAAAAVALLLSACSTPKPPAESAPWFRDVAAETGLRFTHSPGATGKFYLPEIMGSGGALLDYDSDGDLDVFLVQGSPGAGSNKLFRNELVPSGRLAFTDVTAQAGLERAGYGMGAATGDFDNDGRVDLLVTAFGANALYRNNGDGTFRDVTAQSPGIAQPGPWSASASFFDYDGDGWQDLVILNYLDYSFAADKPCFAPTGERDYCTPRVYRAIASHLFHNERGRFVDVTARSGFDRAAGPALGVVAIDANRDGRLDLFIANDSAANHLWINLGGGRFEERALDHGVAYAEEGLAKAGMGIAAGDADNDGDEDLLVLNLMREGATLFENNGAAGFHDRSRASRLHALTFLFTGFGAGWLDFDRDGRLDLFLANGAVTRREEQRGRPYPFEERNLLLRNAGETFEDVTARAGPDAGRPGVSRGAAFGDIDNDGDTDILVTLNNGAVRLLRNDTPSRNWIGVTAPAGAKVVIQPRGGPAQTRWVRTDASYLSASDPRVLFGLGAAAAVDWLEISAGGRSRKIAGPALNRWIDAR